MSSPPSTTDVRTLQERLAAAGFDPGEHDGTLGPRTTKALRDFQAANDLPADGLPGPQTWSVLEKAAHAPPRAAEKAAQKAAPQRRSSAARQEVVQEKAEEEVAPPTASPTPPRFVLPRVAADSLRGVDLLDRSARIEFLASVLSAQELETPLAIGLFGDWGSGKSFFMRRLQERIVEVTEASARRARDEASLYCSHIRQVSFNAWLYAGGDIWPSFAAQVFRSVAGTDAEAPEGEKQTDDLRRFQERVAEDMRSRAQRRAQAQGEVAALDARIEELTREIADRRLRLTDQQLALGGEAAAVAGGVEDARETASGLRRIAAAWRELGARDLALVLVPAAVALVFFVVALVRPSWATILSTGLFAVLGLLAFTAKAVRHVDAVTRLRAETRKLEEARRELVEQRETWAKERSEADRALATREAPLVPEYAEEQAERWLGRERLDEVTEIRLAFERLSDLIGESRAARLSGAAEPGAYLPIDRIVVYVDDLDRCQHEVVVSVLETLKLLVSLPHFVVVVGVDSRWLFRSLELHFRDLLGEGDEDEAWAATPQNYLEKIFQYSIVLRPIGGAGFASLIDQLLGPAEPMPLPAPAAASTDEAAPPASDARRPGDEPPSVDLTPDELVVTRPEIEFMKQLAPLFETPRATKRFANVYRLLRVSVGSERIVEDESFEPVLLLLAIGIGFPGLAGALFAEIGRSPRDATWASLVGRLAETQRAPVWEKLVDVLGRAAFAAIEERRLETFRDWIPVVAEFSFHPWQELLPAGTQS